MLEATKPPGETHATTSWAGKIHPWGFVMEKNKQPDRDPNTLSRWAYLVALQVTKGTER
jgi:hypothetical protein